MKKIIEELKNELGNITLVAVSKTKSNEEILEVYKNGIRDFGENYVKELIVKMDILPKDIRWHMIGHLQTNKVKELIKRNVYLIESVDSIKLAKEINKLPNIVLKGFMAIGPKTDDVNIIRKSFKQMKELKDKYSLELLSMGMSSDYKIAIEEKTDIVRIGTKIFGERVYNQN